MQSLTYFFSHRSGSEWHCYVDGCALFFVLASIYLITFAIKYIVACRLLRNKRLLLMTSPSFRIGRTNQQYRCVFENTHNRQRWHRRKCSLFRSFVCPGLSRAFVVLPIDDFYFQSDEIVDFIVRTQERNWFDGKNSLAISQFSFISGGGYDSNSNEQFHRSSDLCLSVNTNKNKKRNGRS